MEIAGRRLKYAGDVLATLQHKAGWELDAACAFVEGIPDAPTIDPIHYAGGCYCRECIFAREKYGKIECINGVSYQNTYNSPDMFCSHGRRREGAE